MATVKDTLLRQIALLQLIPRAPKRVSTPVLLEKLKDKGFSISMRSLQRDLESLETPLSLVREVDGKTFLWSFDESAAGVNLPRLDTPTALALHLAESHLHYLLPQGVMQQLGPQFRAARNYLEALEGNALARWPRRVRAIPNGQALRPAEISAKVWTIVSDALMQHQQLQVTYLSRSKGEHKTMRLHPQSLVSRHAVSYLVCMVDDYEDLRHLALHRLEQAELLPEPARLRDGHDLDDYIASGAFAMLRSKNTVELVADIDAQTAWLLRETPLSDEQEITPLEGVNADKTGWFLLRAKLPDSQETLWWILGLNNHIHVHAPAHWVGEISELISKMKVFYP